MDPAYIPQSEEVSADADLAFISASGLAANGRLEEAQSMLCQGGLSPSTPRALDLLARIAVQSGDFQRARKLWESALQGDPSYEPAKKALQSLGTPWFALAVTKRIAFLAFVTAAACLAFVGLLAILLRLHDSSSPAPTALARQSIEAIATARPTPPPGVGAGARAPAATPASSNAPPEAAPASTTNSQVAADTLLAVRQTQDAVNNLQRAAELQQRAGQRQADALTAALYALHTNHAAVLQQQSATHDRMAEISQALKDATNHQHRTQQSVEAMRAQVRSLAEGYAAAQRAATNPPLTPKHPPFNPHIKGVTVTSQGHQWEVRFESGIFDRDTHFKPDSKGLLTSVAKALVQTQQKLTVQVIGLACQEPPTWPWSTLKTDGELGLARALTVTSYLQSLGIFPPNTLTSHAGLHEDLPFPARSSDNRTVVLRITQQ